MGLRGFGLHFDFHAHPHEGMPCIGETLTEDEIRTICRTIRPDFLQVDCKGHPGWTSYPSKIGNAMPMIKADTLRMWRKVTKEEGVGLYMHYSGVIDSRYCKEHPDQCILRADGTRSPNVTRTFTLRYADELLIPQLKELAGVYGVDGVWIDGECWGTDTDYDPETAAGFEKETGICLNEQLPTSPELPYYREYREYCRELFRRYVRYYTDAVHAEYPAFRIASNWAFSDYMPEPVCANVDFISGDFSPWDSIDSARYAGRAIASQGREWDLMSWNFRANLGDNPPGYAVKHPLQIMQEAASVASLGGGFQNYITQYADGSPRMEQVLAMKPVADLVRSRAPWCFGAKIRPELAVLLSTHDRYIEGKTLFQRTGNDKIMGLTSLLCDAGRSTAVVSEHSMFRENYRVLVIPELSAVPEEKTVDSLLNYAKDGGSLLLTGVNTCKCFAAHIPGVHVSDCTDRQRFFTPDGSFFTTVEGSARIDADGSEVLAEVCETARSVRMPFAACISFGKGKIALIPADLGSAYQTYEQFGHARLINRVLDRLYTPFVSVTDSEGCIEVTCLQKDGAELIQLVNMNGPHKSLNIATSDRIQPCRDVKLLIRTNHIPGNVTLRPSGAELPFKRERDGISVCIDRVDLHEIIEVRN